MSLKINKKSKKSEKLAARHRKLMMYGRYLADKIENSINKDDFISLIRCESSTKDKISFFQGHPQLQRFASSNSLAISIITVLEYLSFNLNEEDKNLFQDFIKEIARVKNEYNLQSGKICIRQFYSTEFIVRANGDLQSQLDRKKIWFGRFH